jgi:trehalose 6-phosphate synthase/phosphatase
MLQVDLRNQTKCESRPAGRDGQRLVVVSNRLPIQFSLDAQGAWRAVPSGGGLVTALLPVLRDRGGVWIGWPGATDDLNELATALDERAKRAGYSFTAVELTTEEIRDFYLGSSNEIIWPLFHDMQALCNFEPKFWRTYCEVNRKYAAVIRRQSQPGDFIWVHDCHLMNVAVELRKLGNTSHLGFFLHIPFPAPDIFMTLPWRESLLHALLELDLSGFQTLRDQRNFVRCARMLVSDFESEGRGQMLVARVAKRENRIGSFPISIDCKSFVQGAESEAVERKAEELHRLLPNRKLILGIDRLDYTRGIPAAAQGVRGFIHTLSGVASESVADASCGAES